jgi:hypothetical protein
MSFFKRFIAPALIVVFIMLMCGCGTELGAIQPGSRVPITGMSEQSDDIQYEAEGQVRNNRIEASSKNTVNLFWNDPVFKGFKDTGKLYGEYEQQLLNEAKAIGIDTAKLTKALDTAMALKDCKTLIYPVVIETGKYNNRDCFILVFTWEFKDMVKGQKTVKPLGHIFIAAIEADSQEVIASESCR